MYIYIEVNKDLLKIMQLYWSFTQEQIEPLRLLLKCIKDTDFKQLLLIRW